MAITTNQRIMVAVSRLAEYGLLDCRPALLHLSQVSNPDRTELEKLTRRYLDDAHTEIAGTSPHGTSRMFLHMHYAGYVAYDVRATAQGLRGTPPSAAVWALLSATLTLLLVRAKDSQGRAKVVEWVKNATATLAEL